MYSSKIRGSFLLWTQLKSRCMALVVIKFYLKGMEIGLKG